MIEQIVDENGRDIYQSDPVTAGTVMSSSTSSLLESMMTQTVRSGTCRKAFRSASKDRVLSRLVIGGKTGSIDNREKTRRIDWFVGFAKEKNGTEKIAVAVAVGHGEYIGTKAAEFARYTFKSFFKEYFASTDKESSRPG
jgi:cell division protein FtsI/penicillin-binding protein 2